MKVLLASVSLTCMASLRLSAVTAFRGIPSRRIQAFRYHRNLSSDCSMLSNGQSPIKSSSFEVEKKFVVPANIEERLLQWEFVKHRQLDMTDWYFDTPSFELLQQNVWLRCRKLGHVNDKDEHNGGPWQIKIGQQQNSNNLRDDSAIPVYVEMEGVPALEKAASYLYPSKGLVKAPGYPNSKDDDGSSFFAKYTVPQVPALPATDGSLASQLVPLARIFASRSSWMNTKLNIRVDLDETDFGHAVGEVEMVVEDEACVDSARTQVREWVTKLQESTVDSSSVSPISAMGKLEYYLYHYRPHVYRVCVECGVLG